MNRYQPTPLAMSPPSYVCLHLLCMHLTPLSPDLCSYGRTLPRLSCGQGGMLGRAYCAWHNTGSSNYQPRTLGTSCTSTQGLLGLVPVPAGTPVPQYRYYTLQLAALWLLLPVLPHKMSQYLAGTCNGNLYVTDSTCNELIKHLG